MIACVRTFAARGERWRVVRQPVVDEWNLVRPPPAGLLFISDAGQRRLFSWVQSSLPSERELQLFSEKELSSLLDLAERAD